MKFLIQKIKILVIATTLLLPFGGYAKNGNDTAKIKEVPTVVTPSSKSSGNSAKVQETPTVVTPEVVPESTLSSKEIRLSYAVLAFALCVIGLVLIGFRNHSNAVATKDLTRTITSVVIITSVLFLITCGYSAEQIQPALGLLGALAGYVLGQQSYNGGSSGSDKPKDADA